MFVISKFAKQLKLEKPLFNYLEIFCCMVRYRIRVFLWGKTPIVFVTPTGPGGWLDHSFGQRAVLQWVDTVAGYLFAAVCFSSMRVN